jgi:uncharacterized Ntn-hydrolase superfamily protein
LRVDDHPDPITELRRLVALHRIYFDRGSADLRPLDDATLRRIANALVRVGDLEDQGADRSAVLAALETWAGRENLEERMRADDQVDTVVLDMLEAQSQQRGG